MITDQLVSYIESQLKKNLPKEIITSRLLQAGWHPLDIEEGFLAIASSGVPSPVPSPVISTTTTESKNEVKVDPYRELPNGNSPQTNTSPKVWIPRSVAPTEEITVQPTQVKPASPSPIVAETDRTQKFQSKVYVYVIPTKDDKAQTAAQVIKDDLFPALSPKEIVSPLPEQLPKHDGQSVSGVAPTNQEQKPIPVTQQNVHQYVSPTQINNILPVDAQISSSSSPRRFGKIASVVLLILVLFGLVFSIKSGYIKIPSFSFVKKDPKAVILSLGSSLKKYDAYSADTKIVISSPLLTDITTGILSGEAVSSTERDFISFSIKSTIDNRQSLLASHAVTIQSSLLTQALLVSVVRMSDITTIRIPDLESIFQSSAPPASLVSINDNDLPRVIDELPFSMKIFIKNSDTAHLFSKGISPYIKTESRNTLKELVSSLSINQKSDEVIHDVKTHHYNINVDRPTVKRFLSELIRISGFSFDENNKSRVDEAIGSLGVDSFEVWIGDGDNILHQYKLSLSLPLSKVIGFDDNGIAGNEVHIDITGSFYDFDIPHVIELPQNATNFSQFVNTIRDFKIKNTLSSFTSQAKGLQKIEGRYGRVPNGTGSCLSPVSGSLFSPTGHADKAHAQVALIAGAMNTLLSSTTHAPVCYSTASAWLVAAPLSSDSSLIFCADSTGANKTLSLMPRGTTCK